MANMDMDVAWCLNCSKRTRDARNPYCSESCRAADTVPSTPSITSAPLTSPFPSMISPSTSRSTPKTNTSPIKKAIKPVVNPIPTMVGPDADVSPLVLGPAPGKQAIRDRRAFSFPDPSSPPTPIMLKDRTARQSNNNVLPPFARKTSIVAGMTPSAPGLLDVYSKPGNSKPKGSKSTGANTPNIVSDSVFCSTSESSDNEEAFPSAKSPVSIPGIRLPNGPVTSPTSPQTLPADRRFSTLRSQLPARSSHLRTRESHSPVAVMVASSASSRSREDIISWAKAVGMRPGHDEDSDSDEHGGRSDGRRGRSRTRRKDVLANLPPPSTEPLDEPEHEEASASGTTPKGRIGSALANLAPLVKALTSVTSPSKNHSTSAPGLQSVPAPAELSRVAVVASTLPEDSHRDLFPIGGGTPTLSTISISEVVDPSIAGTHDQVDIITDDQQSLSSDIYLRRASAMLSKRPSMDRKPSTTTPLKPITSTANAIWNFGSYLRSFAPFSISSVITPYNPPPAISESVDPLTPIRGGTGAGASVSTPSLVKSPRYREWNPSQPTQAPAPIPRSGDPHDTTKQELVKSLPMDIMFPPPTADCDGEANRRSSHIPPEVSSRSHSCVRSPSRRRSHSRNRMISSDQPRSRSSSAGGERWSGHDDEDDSHRRRGRSRQGKQLGVGVGSPLRDINAVVATLHDIFPPSDSDREVPTRGRERDSKSRGKTSEERGRKRDRGVRA